MIDDRHFCYWKDVSNSELQWYATDSEVIYQHNLKYRYEELQYHEWIDSSISYKFNSDGFRCNEFTNTDTIMFLGCSVTLGVGLPEYKTFPYIISQQLNLNNANLAVIGSSADTAFRLSQIYFNKIRPKIVVSTLLFPERLELLSNDDVYNFTPNAGKVPNHLRENMPKANKNITKYKQFEYYKIWLQQKENVELNFKKNKLAIAQTCHEYNIKHIILTMEDCKKFLCHGQKYSKARDLQHPGSLFHQHISQVILNQL